MMTKKNYTAVAAVVKYEVDYLDRCAEGKQNTQVIAELRSARSAVERVALDLSHYFASDNPRFNTHKFKDACGVGQENGN